MYKNTTTIKKTLTYRYFVQIWKKVFYAFYIFVLIISFIFIEIGIKNILNTKLQI